MCRHDDRMVVGVVLVQSSGQRCPVERLQLRVEAAAPGGELSTQDGVLKHQRRQQRGRDRQKLRTQILNLPLQLHSPVLKPRFHLKNTNERTMSMNYNHRFY